MKKRPTVKNIQILEERIALLRKDIDEGEARYEGCLAANSELWRQIHAVKKFFHYLAEKNPYLLPDMLMEAADLFKSPDDKLDKREAAESGQRVETLYRINKKFFSKD